MLESLSDLPVHWANIITFVLFLGVALGVYRVPKEVVLRDAPDKSLWRDYRFWALVLIAIQLCIYALFS